MLEVMSSARLESQVTFPRRCVFVGSISVDKYLDDPTGNCRHWPVVTPAPDQAAALVSVLAGAVESAPGVPRC